MDSIGLATAITNYWRGTYGHSPSENNQQSQFYTIDGIRRRIKNNLSSRSARAWLVLGVTYAVTYSNRLDLVVTYS